MRQIMWFACLSLWFVVASATSMHKDENHESSNSLTRMESNSCDLGIRFTEAAERRLGGAHYTHAAAMEPDMGENQDHQMGEANASVGEQAPKMHEHHHPQYGGEQFFMAPGKRHHIEMVYSERCGLRVILYNAYSEPISPARLRAFVLVIPSVETEPERMRFLELSNDGSALEAMLGADLSRPFEAELYLQLPESEEPELFNLIISKQAE